MKRLVLFSVIIPCYNSQDTIKRTLESVVNQIYKNYEIILVDDGSTDNTKIAIKEFFKNKSIAYKYLYQENCGPSAARNRGVENSSGEYIAFLDSDDVWHPQKLEIMLHLIKENKVDILGHAYTLEDNFDKIFEKTDLKRVGFLYLLLKNFAVTPSIIMRRAIFGYFNENMSHTEDHELWLRTALSHHIYYVDLPLVQLGRPQLADGGLSSDKWAMRKGEMKMYKNIVLLKKSLIPFVPFLILFSLLKHFRSFIKDMFAKK